ncbi:undecaprenyl-diphosphatase [Virgibacillus phasianinus]|uniref:Undecaprenyl-diphosphatase n=1 Tax=Virgibacillus phasianinus TaxID=2017483 RepID=A0A220U7T6_9BACI|nr:undecaprenyl-diphosphatase [Virgibacillus phasianinus]ASK64105.1 undecaprenyl-diphosphatase [Virgibacillus phasianinus]
MDLFEQQNVNLFRAINDLGKQYTYLNPVFEFIAEYMVYFLCLSVIMFWFSRGNNKNRIMIISAGIAFVLAEIIGKLAGLFHSNNQPFATLSNVNKLIEHSIDNSFPSDHTILFFAFCFSFWLFGKRFGFVWIILASLVAFSRIWVGVHYPADVIVGGGIGIIAAFITYLIVPRIDFIKQLLKVYEKGERYILSSGKRSRDH